MSEAALIELQLRRIEQLFDTLDPSPFREGDLDRAAEAYIVEAAQELPPDAALRIVIRLPPGDAAGDAAAAPAIARYFALRAEAETQAMRQLFRDGRVALGIGLGILGVCLLIAGLAGATPRAASFGRLVQESFVILGWVAIWRPSEMFLYDWLPMARRRRLFRRLAAAGVTTLRGAA